MATYSEDSLYVHRCRNLKPSSILMQLSFTFKEIDYYVMTQTCAENGKRGSGLGRPITSHTAETNCQRLN